MRPEALPIALAILSLPVLLPAQDRKVDFQKEVQPIFRDHCVKCHGADKVEGDLRLDLKKHVFHDDEIMWSVVPGEVDDSILYERITLPADDPDVMPAEGDPLSKEQVETIRLWIAQGAEWPEAADQAVLAAAERRAARENIPLPEVSEEQLARVERALKTLEGTGALAGRIAANTQAVEVNFSLLGDRVGDAEIELLAGLEPVLVWVNLARTKVTAEGLEALAAFPHVRRLNLANAAGVDDAAMPHVAKLAELEYLNLYGTGVTDGGIDQLRGLPRLAKLFVWQTGVTAAGAKMLGGAIPGLSIDRGEAAAAMLEPAKEEAPELVNSKCPVSGEPVDPAHTSNYLGKLVGFCCGNCKAKFDADPEKFAAKIDGTAAAKPANATCPVSGEPVDLAQTSVFQGQTVAFCCANCKAKFDAEPAKFAAKLGIEVKAAPINDKCPVSGEPVDPAHTSVYEGKVVGFCCGNCKKKFDADPKKFAAKLPGGEVAAAVVR